MDAPTSTDLRQGTRFIARDGTVGGESGKEIDLRTHVVAELEPTAGRVRLHITEDTSGYGVTAACGDVDAGDFDVQLLDNRVWIGRSDAMARRAGVAEPRAVERRGIERLFSLAFEQPIDALKSRGECADGWLYLWLKKTDACTDAGARMSS
jgi:hypothetical protein